MRELPKYAILTDNDIPGIKVIQLERPYIIASVHDYKRDDPRVEDYMEAMAQERFPVAKVKGYTVFLTMYTSLEPNSDSAYQKEILNEMADYFLSGKIAKKPGQFMKSEESGRDEIRYDKDRIIRLRERRKK